MIVTDLDGTLLKSDKTISDYTKSVFQRCQENGIKIVLATARPIRTVKDMIRIEYHAAIYHNGAVIAINDNPHIHIGIEHAMAKRLLLYTANHFKDMQIAVEIDDVLYANFDVATVWTNTTAVITDFSDLPDMPVDKIIFITAQSHIVSEIDGLLPDELYSVIAENQVLMIMHKKANKLSAIKAVAKHFGLTLSDIVVFGDDYNDIEMLRECCIGIAMDNAIDEVKSAADQICGTNDHDGVAKWLDKNIL